MEKPTPHCKLSLIKSLVVQQRVRATRSAREGAHALGYDYAQMLAMIGHLQHSDFYKSMTTHKDHRIWQDVYKINAAKGNIYVKLTVVEDVLIVSFKEL
jgi:motility quorum-sensing regulator / GCU-specific mRNA interferase toxin